LTEIVVDTDADVKNRLLSGALKRRLWTLSEGIVILSIRDPNITTIGIMNLPHERARDAPFYKCESLLRVDLKGCTKLTNLGDAAFVPDSLTQLGKGAFQNCSSLTSVVLPDSLMQVGDVAFGRCNSLTSIALPACAKLGDNLFDECDSFGRICHNQAVNNADGTEAEKHASALALFPAKNSGSL